MERPETRFAWNEDVSLAYQIVGGGPVDLLYLQGYASQVDLNWESPYLSRFPARACAPHTSHNHGPKRVGVLGAILAGSRADLDTYTDDLRVVLDAAGSEKAAILATGDCGILAIPFAASHPERTAALILVDAWANYSWTEETPWAPTFEQSQEDAEWLRVRWGTSAWTEYLVELAGSELRDEERRELDWLERTIRATSTPGAMSAELRRYSDADVRHGSADDPGPNTDLRRPN